MTQVICIVGLPGSGKSHLAQQFGEELPACLVIDDIKQLDELPPDGQYENLVIADPFFCMSYIRENASRKLNDLYHRDIKWIFFENDPLQCLENVRQRQRARDVEGFIGILTSQYNIPDDQETKRVWRPIP